VDSRQDVGGAPNGCSQQYEHHRGEQRHQVVRSAVKDDDGKREARYRHDDTERE
jgi:hypothetical protein